MVEGENIYESNKHYNYIIHTSLAPLVLISLALQPVPILIGGIALS